MAGQDCEHLIAFVLRRQMNRDSRKAREPGKFLVYRIGADDGKLETGEPGEVPWMDTGRRGCRLSMVITESDRGTMIYHIMNIYHNSLP